MHANRMTALFIVVEAVERPIRPISEAEISIVVRSQHYTSFRPYYLGLSEESHIPQSSLAGCTYPTFNSISLPAHSGTHYENLPRYFDFLLDY